LTKQQQQQLGEDLHARHAMQLAFCEKDKKHTIDKNALLKSHEADNEWLKKQEESMSERVDQACREKEDKFTQLQNQQLEADTDYCKKQLDTVQEKLQGEHDRTLRFVTETLRSNTLAETAIEMPQLVVPALSDIVPNMSSDQGMKPPVARAPSAPKEPSSEQSSSSSKNHRSNCSQSSASSHSHSSLPPADEPVPPPPPPASS